MAYTSFQTILPDPNNGVAAGGQSSSVSGDKGPGFASISITSGSPIQVSTTNSGRVTTRGIAGHKYTMSITYNPMTRDSFEPVYNFLLEKRATTIIAQAGIFPRTKVIERPRSFGVIRPNKDNIMYGFSASGFAIALAIAVFRAFMFHRIESVRELEKASSFPVLGGIPFVENIDSSKITNISPKSSLSESFRTIRTNLQYLGKSEESGKVILVTSIKPSEGKTFTSTNLALILARGSKKVLLMDFDMHKPRMHKAFGLSNEKGVSSCLIGKDMFDDVLRKSEQDNLNVVIELKSHTDYIGSDALNDKLSQQRADVCVAYLISQGIDAGQLVAKGIGENEPFVIESKDGKLKEGDVLTEKYIKNIRFKKNKEKANQYNRRTSFKVLREDYISNKTEETAADKKK